METHQETINGLLTQKPQNPPQIGEIKTFLVEHRTGKSGKPWFKIKNSSPDYGGTPYRVINVEQTDYQDARGNVSFNVELEPTPQAPQNAPQSTPARQNDEDGVQATREHLMRSANLYVMCVKAANLAVAPNMPEIAQTSEQFGAIVGQLFREAYSRRTDDGVNWWSYVDKMPAHPLK